MTDYPDELWKTEPLDPELLRPDPALMASPEGDTKGLAELRQEAANWEEGRLLLSHATPEQAALRLLSSLETWGNVPEAHRVDTPRRLVSALRDLTTREEFKFTTFPSTSDEMVSVGPVPFYTLCAHHVLPFYGQAYVSYVPGDTIAGLSKLARAVRYLAKGLWVQEELTGAMATFLEERLSPRGVAVLLDAEHMCMAIRGVEVSDCITRTAVMRGVFGDHDRTAKAEFMEFVKARGK